jgi:hypothetical protein
MVSCDTDTVKAGGSTIDDIFSKDNERGEIDYTLSFSLDEDDQKRYNFTLWDLQGIDSDFIEDPVIDLDW